MNEILSRLKAGGVRDFTASIVVFLVAMPLCMGIAVASGVPPEKGLVTGIIGGLVVGLLAGSPLQVSGPAAGLAVIVFELVRDYGASALGPILVLAGLIQFVAGIFKLGGWFRAISPAVVHGMLAGIGVLIVVGQFHVLFDAKPLASGLENLAAMPGRFLGLEPRRHFGRGARTRDRRADDRGHAGLGEVPPEVAEARPRRARRRRFRDVGRLVRRPRRRARDGAEQHPQRDRRARQRPARQAARSVDLRHRARHRLHRQCRDLALGRSGRSHA
jgi:hypothetical protein